MLIPRVVLVILLFTLYSIVSGQSSSPSLAESFSQYDHGSDGRPGWAPARGFWIIQNGEYIQETDDYDCVSYYALPLGGSFSAEITFRQISGEPGSGLVFSGSGTGGTSFAHMGRFDGATTFITGYFLGGEFTTIASTTTDSIRPGIDHTLRIEVDGKKKEYSFSLDSNTLLEGQPLLYASGYFGLQSSGGSVAFLRVAINPGEPRGEEAYFDRIQRFASLGGNEVAFPDPLSGNITLIDTEGNRRRVLGRGVAHGGIFDRPCDVKMYRDSLLLVSDTGTHRVHLISITSGKVERTIGGEGMTKGKFRQPVALATDTRGNIYVVDRLNNRVQIFDSTHNPAEPFGGDRLRSPSDIAIEGSSLFVLNTGLSQVELYALTGGIPSWQRSISYGGGKAHGIAVLNGCLYISIVQEVRKYSPPYSTYSSFRGRALGFIAPRQIVIRAPDEVWLADYLHGRIVVTDTSLSDPGPSIDFASPGARVTWSSNVKGQGSLLIGSGAPAIAANTLAPGWYQALIPPSVVTRHIRIAPSLRTIPAENRHSMPFPLPPDPMPERTSYARLQLVALLFTNVINDAIEGLQQPEASPASQQEVDRIRRQIEDGVRFYWIHSGFKLHLDVDFVIVREALKRSDLYGGEWWYPPRESVLTAALRTNGKNITSYPGVLYVALTQEYDSAAGRHVLSGKGGGFTNGVGTGKGYGISWWDVTRSGHNAGNNWLMVHEFNHQLDDIFAASGYPEYWFNHISPTIGTAARFGEHFDANSQILQMVPRAEWLDLKYTTVRDFADADADGIPDLDPGLPLDEERLGSSSHSTDSDQDGVLDFTEIMQSNWINEGWGETYGNPALFPSLTSTDTDGDGLVDSIDPIPCARISSVVKKGYPARTNSFPSDSSYLLGQVAVGGTSAGWYASWDSQEICIQVLLNKPAPLKIMIDANADGWFLGRDNILITTSPGQDTGISQRVQLLNATDPEQWPFMDAGLASSIPIHSRMDRIGSGVRVSIRVGRAVGSGLDLVKDKRLGLLLGMQPASSRPGSRYTTLSEPNRFFNVRLE